MQRPAGGKVRRSPRLKHFEYRGAFAYHLVLVTRQRRPAFADGAVVARCLDALRSTAAKCRFVLLAYCFMPDHLHLLVVGDSRASLPAFVRTLKQVTGYYYKKEHGLPLWQVSYFDHVLRREEDLSVVAQYIWNNPVRAGLAADASAYPYSGPKEIMQAGPWL